MITFYYILGLLTVLILLKIIIGRIVEYRIRKQLEYRISKDANSEKVMKALVGKPSIIIDKTGEKPCFRVGFVKRIDGDIIEIELPSIGKTVLAVKEGNNYVYQ